MQSLSIVKETLKITVYPFTKTYLKMDRGGNTMNNQMELLAAIEGLAALKEPCSVELFTDSKYVMDGITQWIKNWKKNTIFS